VQSAFIVGGYITGSFLRAPSRSACAYWNIRSECVGGASYRTATASSMSRSPTDRGPPIDVSAVRAADRCNGDHPTLSASGGPCLFKKRSAGPARDKPMPALLDHVEPGQLCKGISNFCFEAVLQRSSSRRHAEIRETSAASIALCNPMIGEIASAAQECSRRKMLLPPGSLHYRCPTASTASRPASPSCLRPVSWWAFRLDPVLAAGRWSV